MSEISLETIKRLKDLTGVGLTDAKAALVESDGDFDKALEAMRKKGLTKAEKRSEREASAGIIATYVHDSRIGAMIELNCETDFVAKTDEFKDLARKIAIHVSATNPDYVSADSVSEDEKAKVIADFKQKVIDEGKPADKAEMIVQGMLGKFFSERSLLDQPFVMDDSKTVGQMVLETSARLGEKIAVRRFSRMEIGQKNI